MQAMRLSLMLALVGWQAGCIEGAKLTGPVPEGFDIPGAVYPDIVVSEDVDLDTSDDDVAGDIPDTAASEVSPEDVRLDASDAELRPCVTVADCGEDVDLCDGTWDCIESLCVAVEAVVCDQSTAGPCEQAQCVAATGACVVVAAHEGKPCDDGDGCTVGSQCHAGACQGRRMYCDDHNPCTEDACEDGACRYSPRIDQACDDGNPCTTDERCTSDGRCTGELSSCACDTDADCPDNTTDLCAGDIRCFAGSCAVAVLSVGHGTCPESEDPCQLALCDPTDGNCGTVAAPDGAGCDDGDACTRDDQCVAGVCVGSEVVCGGGSCAPEVCDPTEGCVASADESPCECAETSDCAAYEDEDLCNGTLVCTGGRCLVDPSTVRRCPPDLPCQSCGCDAATGELVVESLLDGEPCDGGDPCVVGTTCTAGVCSGGTTADCEDAGECVVGQCHPFAGCKTLTTNEACAPDALCSTDVCALGTCVQISVKSCPANEACLAWGCDEGTGLCQSNPVNPGEECDDGAACTHNDQCIGGGCVGAPRVCDDGNPCTDDACDNDLGGCQFSPNQQVCSDGNSCTQGDYCAAGLCVSGVSTCSCESASDCFSYDDGDACTGVVICQEGACVVDPATVPEPCDTSEDTDCRVNTCVDGACTFVSRGEGWPCYDHNLCTSNDICVDEVCVGDERICDDGNPCTLDGCEPFYGCSFTPINSGSCDDGSSCTTDTSCIAGECGGGVSTCLCADDTDCAAYDDDLCKGRHVCTAQGCQIDPSTVVTCEQWGGACATVACEPSTGLCVAEPAPLGTSCQDGDPCTQGDTCQNGSCVGGPEPDCGSTACADAWCDPVTGSCVALPLESSCDDGNLCTENDQCQGGVCVGDFTGCQCAIDSDCDSLPFDRCAGDYVCLGGACALVPDTAVVCEGGDDSPCSYVGCNSLTGSCEAIQLGVGVECEDDDPCTFGTRCGSDGLCAGFSEDCDDGEACTADLCDPAIGCIHTPLDEGSLCDDGEACTGESTCQGGACVAVSQLCSCTSAANCPNGDLCAGIYECVAGSCVRGEPVECEPSDTACEANVCDPTTGLCSLVDNDGALCSDGDLCTAFDSCFFGGCFGSSVSCDDDNECTDDACVFGTCQHTPNTADCDDGDPICTTDESCQAGACVATTNVCLCQGDSDCVDFDDGDVCNGLWQCQDGFCAHAPDTMITCEDASATDCIEVVCNPTSGECEELLLDEGLWCDDASVCTPETSCDASGNCVGESVVQCDDLDANDCVNTTCHPLLGVCVPEQKVDGVACSDGTVCTEQDTCVKGQCVGAALDCGESTSCTAVTCLADEGCAVSLLFGSCDDGDACTEGSYCAGGSCTGGTELCGCENDTDCAHLDDLDLCNGSYVCDVAEQRCVIDPASVVTCTTPPNSSACDVGVCEPSTGECSVVVAPDDTFCGDSGDPCDISTCLSGFCLIGALNCDDGNDCTEDSCGTSQSCVNEVSEELSACDDGLPCTGDGQCVAGVCEAGASNDQCSCATDFDCLAIDDDDLCNGRLVCDVVQGHCVLDSATVVTCPDSADSCLEQRCVPSTGACLKVAADDGYACNDQDDCTYGDQCLAGLCEGTAVDCEDGESCTHDSCQPGIGCVSNSVLGICDDDNPCTELEFCSNGTCGDGVELDCEDDNVCTFDLCESDTGCLNLAFNDGAACGDDEQCSERVCAAGSCEGPLTCPCVTTDDCVQPSGDDLCGVRYECEAGMCQYRPPTECPAGDICVEWVCDPSTGACNSTATNEGISCDDNNACTQDELCISGVCEGTPLLCEGEEACRVQTCDVYTGCAWIDKDTPCDDGNACTTGDYCNLGVCASGPLTSGSVFPFAYASLSEQWTVTSTGENATWSISDSNAVGGEGFALLAGNPESLSFEDSDAGGVPLAWQARAQMPTILIPEGVESATLSFAFAYAFPDAGCAEDVFRVEVNGATLFQRCAGHSNGQFEAVQVDVMAFAGIPVNYEFLVDTVTASNNAGGVVYIDDIVVDWSCSE